MRDRRHAEIAGGGFTGLTLAAALAQRGWSVRVHERAAEIRAFGAGIWLWENGVRVLNAIGAADEGISGYRAYMVITSMPISQPLDDLVTVELTMKHARYKEGTSYVEPDWFYQDAPDESDGAPVATAPTSDP